MINIDSIPKAVLPFDHLASYAYLKVSTSFTEQQVATRAEVEGFLGPSAVSEGIPGQSTLFPPQP